MIRFAALLFVIILAIGCSNKIDDKVGQEMIKALENNNVMLDKAADDIFHEFQKKLEKPDTKEKAEIWFPKARLADSLCKQFITQTYDKQNLYNQFINYKNKIVEINIKAKEELKETLAQNFSETNKSNTVDTLAFSLYKNKSIQLRNIFIDWCLKQIGATGWSCEFPIGFTSQNSTHFKPNQKLEITVGIGYYSTKLHQKIYVDNKEVYLTREGVAEYKINVGTTLGKHKKKITISYISPDGATHTMEKEISYTVD